MAPVGSPCVAGPLAVHATARRSCTHGPATPHVWARTAVVAATVLVAVALLQPIYAQTRTAAIPSPQAPANQQPQQALQGVGRFVPDESLARLPPGQKRAVPPAHTWHRSNILLFGDSLTELGTSPASGWSNALADRYKRRADVINRGFGGYTSKQGLEILPEILETIDLGRTLLAVVWFGTNDAATPDGPQ
ncbi:hypothetical protein MNEG_6922 [Monoraphidium neglectum]|uniref:SGNH hydrolase-type esterase domain-containing protein n=1 Tax=Monoraphidium neglectum TaxID=145388 RepID=A0A0D2MKB2_9CHLO|nr:hypothetical protein MNEG_6922 [Monoraphidium neglectum]KIZ01037.1 hypothetical protein MNEG_6922 [Monoraphidium neglectum]|eukprot:XP_013900056.1 hypothetical protein MNEG_6922 [Monoraphidium neglectum]